MRKFEKQFPGLKDNHQRNLSGLPYIINYFGYKIFNQKTIQKYCLDKQEVKEAIRDVAYELQENPKMTPMQLIIRFEEMLEK